MLEGCINGLAAVSIQKESIELKFKFNAFESNVSIQPEKNISELQCIQANVDYVQWTWVVNLVLTRYNSSSFILLASFDLMR